MRRQQQHAQAGVGQLLLLVFLVVIFCAICLIGYKVYPNLSNGGTGNATSTSPDVTDTPVISSGEDLDKATTALDRIEIDTADQSDASTLETEFDSF